MMLFTDKTRTHISTSALWASLRQRHSPDSALDSVEGDSGQQLKVCFTGKPLGYKRGISAASADDWAVTQVEVLLASMCTS